MTGKRKGYDFDGIVVGNRFDAYMDVSGLIKVGIDDKLRKFPLDKRKSFDKSILRSLKRLEETVEVLEKAPVEKQNTREYTYLARELTTGYLYANDAVLPYEGTETGRDFTNRINLTNQMRKILLAKQLVVK